MEDLVNEAREREREAAELAAMVLTHYKLTVWDTTKSTKRKQQKHSASEQSEMTWVRPNDRNLKFKTTPADRREEEEEEKLVAEEIEIIGCSYWYDPFSTSGLDDSSLASELSDIEQ